MNEFQAHINKCVTVLNDKGTILFPTDTLWSIGCDATDDKAVEKIFQLKQQTLNKPFISLVVNQAMLERYVVNIPEVAYDIIDLALKPTTIIFDQPKGLANNLIGTDGSVAIRVASNKFCQYLINKFKKPILTTSANSLNQPYPKNFDAISPEISQSVDYVVNLQLEKENASPSSIIKLGNDGTVKVIRK